MSKHFTANDSDRNFRTIFEKMSDPNLLLREGQFVDCNNAALKLLGYSSKADFLQRRPQDISPTVQPDGRDSDEKAADMIAIALRDGFHRFEWEHTRADGSVVPVEVMLTAIQMDGELLLHTLWRDITERKALENALTRQVHMLKALNEIVAISGLKPRETLRQALRIGLDFLRLDFGIVSHIQGSDYEVVVQSSPPATMTDGLHFVTENTYCNETLKLGDVLAVPDVPKSAYANHPCYRDFGLASYIGAPILVSGNVFGTINFSSPNALAREFGHDIEFIRLLARWAGAFLDRLHFEEELELAASIYQNSSEGMMIADADNNIVAVNPAMEQITGYSARELIGKNPRLLKSGQHDEAFYHEMWDSLIKTGCWQGEIWNVRKNGEAFAEKLSINTIYQDDGSVRRRVALLSDITDKKRTDELIWQQANFDALTALPNRRMFKDRLAQEVKKSNRSKQPLALLFIDLDHFKEVNDTLGHEMGDALLIEVARRITGCVRETDTVARIGGDEFTLILTNLEDPASVERIAENLISQLQQPFELGRGQALISASIGVALYPDEAGDVDTLLRLADDAMYTAKQQGKNRYSHCHAAQR